jgi:hypothetical protein
MKNEEKKIYVYDMRIADKLVEIRELVKILLPKLGNEPGIEKDFLSSGLEEIERIVKSIKGTANIEN